MPRGKLKSTKEADRLLERLRARGHPLYSDDPDLPFAFFISGRTTLDVGEDSRRITNQFQIEMVERLRHKEFGSSLTGLILFPTILNPSIAISDDYVSNKRDGSVHVGVNIDYASWITASFDEKTALFRDCLMQSIGRIAKSRLRQADRDALLSVVEQAYLAARRALAI